MDTPLGMNAHLSSGVGWYENTWAWPLTRWHLRSIVLTFLMTLGKICYNIDQVEMSIEGSTIRTEAGLVEL